MSDIVERLRRSGSRAPGDNSGSLEWQAADEIERLERERDELRLDAARYRWLRDDNAYAPEENHVTGGEELDELCDEGIAYATRAALEAKP